MPTVLFKSPCTRPYLRVTPCIWPFIKNNSVSNAPTPIQGGGSQASNRFTQCQRIGAPSRHSTAEITGNREDSRCRSQHLTCQVSRVELSFFLEPFRKNPTTQSNLEPFLPFTLVSTTLTSPTRRSQSTETGNVHDKYPCGSSRRTSSTSPWTDSFQIS